MSKGRKSLKKRAINAAKLKTKKTGYRFVFQSGLTDAQFKMAFKIFTDFKEHYVDGNGYWKHITRGGHDSFLARNERGLSYLEGMSLLRVSNKKRIFGAIVSETRTFNKERQKWEWRNGNPPHTYAVYETGEIKGQ
jgi:hypothetical protein